MPTGQVEGRRWVALDLDGVVYQGPAALPGAVEAVRALREAGLHLHFVTNASAATIQQVARRLRDLGVACSDSDVATSGHVAARRTRQLVGRGQAVLVVGGAGLAAECAAEGLIVTDDPYAAAVVLVGLDEMFSYGRMAAALVALRRGVPLVGCNRDASYPGAGGVHLPGCGPILAAVEAAAGRAADLVVGKPEPTMLTDLWALTDTGSESWFVVGDTDADIGMAEAAGVPGVLVGDPVRGFASLADFTRQYLGGRR